MLNAKMLHNIAQWSYDADYHMFRSDLNMKGFTDDYVHGKFHEMQANFSRFLGSLSNTYLENLAEAINNRYGEE